MKCMKKGSEVQRVTDKEADQLVTSGWAFCPKSEWKTFKKIPKKNKKEKQAEKAEQAVPAEGTEVIKEAPEKNYL